MGGRGESWSAASGKAAAGPPLTWIFTPSSEMFKPWLMLEDGMGPSAWPGGRMVLSAKQRACR